MVHIQLGVMGKLQFKMDTLSGELCMYRTRNVKGMNITKENSLREILYEY